MSWSKLRKNQEKILGNQGKIREFHGIKKVGTLTYFGGSLCNQSSGFYNRL